MKIKASNHDMSPGTESLLSIFENSITETSEEIEFFIATVHEIKENNTKKIKIVSAEIS